MRYPWRGRELESVLKKLGRVKYARFLLLSFSRLQLGSVWPSNDFSPSFPAGPSEQNAVYVSLSHIFYDFNAQ